MTIRTDLAMEARAIWQKQAGETTLLPGVRASESKSRGIHATTVEILDEQGAQALGKPVGTYICLELTAHLLRDRAGFGRAAVRLGKALAALVPETGAVLVAGLGNPAVTPDALGPRTLSHLLVTRHLQQTLPALRPVSAISPGVLGVTGLESVEVVRGIVERAKPACVVAVDALAACEPGRICTTVQLSNAGITPGSGVRNSRASFSRETLGVPVVAVGVPTVVDGSRVLTALEGAESTQTANSAHSLVLTPRDIDTLVERMARLVGYGISLGLQRELSLGDVLGLLG